MQTISIFDELSFYYESRFSQCIIKMMEVIMTFSVTNLILKLHVILIFIQEFWFLFITTKLDLLNPLLKMKLVLVKLCYLISFLLMIIQELECVTLSVYLFSKEFLIIDHF